MNQIIFFILTLFALTCRSVSYTIPKASSMDLDKIKILSSDLLNSPETNATLTKEENTLTVSLVSKSRASAEVLIAFRREGLNLLDDIKTGRVLAHNIILKNGKGEVLARNPIDLENIKAIEFLQQSIEFDAKKIPAVGEFLSFHLELIYLSPYMDIGCEDSNLHCNKIRSLLNSANLNASVSRTPEQAEADKNSIITRISTINKDLSPLLSKEGGTTVKLTPPLNLGDINALVYRDWKLLSTPTYFKVIAILQNGKPIEDSKPEVFELPELTTETESSKEKDRTFELEKEKKPPKSITTKRRQKTIYLP